MIGRVYKIQHLDSSLSYIGSTCDTLPGRWRSHKNTYKRWVKNKDKYSTVALYPYLEQYGCERFQMLLVGEYEVVDKKQLRAYEQLAISRTKSCCNERASLQLIASNSMYKHYYQIIVERSKDRYQANKNTILLDGAIRVMCECGTETRKDTLTRHRKTAKHARLLAALNASQ